ncbi:hypothetical protein CXB77_15690 [Chromatium okenii]|uniref:Uncharacterized protein n=2 Tax=Chromatium okenii TaxID=61644 RepID=A0A2S7XPT1_9GAMM|nr:hypothetical protein CXB77_15690 [Chromatium okenii]
MLAYQQIFEALMPSAFCVYGHHRQLAQRHCCPNWRAQLPLEWREQVIAPTSFRVFREYEIPARRIIGYDSNNQPCYCAYDYRLIDLRSDDDEEFYTALAYDESLVAWRLHNQHWLIYRCVGAFDENDHGEQQLSVAAQMPR